MADFNSNAAAGNPTAAYPKLNPYEASESTPATSNGNGTLGNAQQRVSDSAASALNSVQNNQTVQNIANGPMAGKARDEAAATSNEFSNLAAARKTPDAQTATGQNLTHYHSLFYSLLSWENPRATGISFVAIVTSILLFRYVPVDRYLLKALFTVLGITAAAEIAGQTILGQGVATKMRPRKYYTIPRETLESVLGDVEELVNFFVIEFQRIIFAENVYATVAAFFTTLIGYFLVKVTPKWGLLLLSTVTIYLAPLIYISNKDFIDHHLNNAAELANQQTAQFRQIASEHTNKAYEVTSSATSQYVKQAQDLIGGAKKQAVDSGYVSKETANTAPGAPVDSKPAADKAADISASAQNASANAQATAQNASSNLQSSAQNASSNLSSSLPSAPKNEPVATNPSLVNEHKDAVPAL